MKIRFWLIIILIIGVIASLYFLIPSLFNFSSPVEVTTTTVSMSLDDFKEMCEETNGEYNDMVSYGIGPVRSIFCGYNKATDAGRLCKTEKQINSCSSCAYGSYCYLAAGDFGPEHCSCFSYKLVKQLSADNIPAIN